MPTPLQTVKERFGSKDKLVEAVKELMSEELWLPRLSADRGGPKGLKNVSNAKLLRLHDTLGKAKEQFGSRDKLIEAVLELGKRAKDTGYRRRLEAYPVPRLLDLLESAKKRAKAVGKAKQEG